MSISEAKINLLVERNITVVVIIRNLGKDYYIQKKKMNYQYHSINFLNLSVRLICNGLISFELLYINPFLKKCKGMNSYLNGPCG